jgi:NitT/TauT family transport system substrate-binding protein
MIDRRTFALGASTALTLAPRAVRAQSPSKVRVGYIGILSDAPFFIGIERGYFKNQGLDVELSRFTSANDTIPLLATGQLEASGGGVAPAIFSAVARDLPVRIVADRGSMPKGHGFNVFVVRKDLYDSGAVRSAKDLRGRPIAITEPTSILYYELAALVKSGGLKLSDVEPVYLSIPDTPTALANGKVDASIIVEPFATSSEIRNIAKIVTTMDQVTPNLQNSCIFYSQLFGQRNNRAAIGWMTAYLQAIREYRTALRSPGSPQWNELVAILSKYTSVKDQNIYSKMIWPGLSEDGAPNVQSIMEQQEFWFSQNQIKERAPANRLIDLSYLNAAKKALPAS